MVNVYEHSAELDRSSLAVLERELQPWKPVHFYFTHTLSFCVKPDSRHTEAPMMSPAKRPKLDLDGSSGQDALMSLESALAASSNDLSFQIEQASQVNTPRSGHKLNCLLFTFLCSSICLEGKQTPLVCHCFKYIVL